MWRQAASEKSFELLLAGLHRMLLDSARARCAVAAGAFTCQHEAAQGAVKGREGVRIRIPPAARRPLCHKHGAKAEAGAAWNDQVDDKAEGEGVAAPASCVAHTSKSGSVGHPHHIVHHKQLQASHLASQPPISQRHQPCSPLSSPTPT